MEVFTMFGKNRKKKVGLCVMVVTACLVLAGIWAVLATPETALATKPPHDHDKEEKEEATYTLAFTDNDEWTPDLFDFTDPLSFDTVQADKNISVRFVKSDLSSLEDCWVGMDGGWDSFLVIIQTKKRKDKMLIRYWFTDSTSGINYVLDMPGTLTTPLDNWPPEEDPAIVTGSGDWDISFTKGNPDGGCEGSGTGLSWTITITKN
jgi:hypothetical protein